MKYVVIHGHFYQPPRIDPWWEEVHFEESASPAPNWNERIFQECYLRNTEAWIKSPYSKMEKINNFSYLSFNFGPTLLSWLVEKYPFFWRRILSANRYSISKWGFGNAVAMSYNHTILPLDNPRDRWTNILWGIEEFKFRYGYRPLGMWLPEAAVNIDVIGDLIRAGIKFVMLTTNQVKEIRKKGGRWKDVYTHEFNPHRIYEIAYGGKRIKAFFSHPQLAQLISFGKILNDAKTTGDIIEEILRGYDKDFVAVLTDGETFGHHHPHSEKGLAYLCKYVLPEKGIEVTNFSYLLNKFDARYEVKLWDDSSWSCAHGIGRWMTDCGCGRESGFHQKWRAPLRKALNFLKKEADLIFEGMGKRIFYSPWEARNDYIKVILEPAWIDAFVEKHLKKVERQKARLLLEMQRWALSMFTSCAWFFNEISGIETVQVLTFAARVIDIIERLTGEKTEKEFLNILKTAPSNIDFFRDGRGVWNKLVKPRIKKDDNMVFATILHYLFTGRDFYKKGKIFYHIRELKRIEEDNKTVILGEIFFEDDTLEKEIFRYFYAERGTKIFIKINEHPFPELRDIRHLRNFSKGKVMEV